MAAEQLEITLADVDLPDLLFLFCMRGKASVLTISCSSGLGSVYFDQGKITHATLGKKTGADAVSAIMAITAGGVTSEDGIVAKKKSCELGIDELAQMAGRSVASPPPMATTLGATTIVAKPILKSELKPEEKIQPIKITAQEKGEDDGGLSLSTEDDPDKIHEDDEALDDTVPEGKELKFYLESGYANYLAKNYKLAERFWLKAYELDQFNPRLKNNLDKIRLL